MERDRVHVIPHQQETLVLDTDHLSIGFGDSWTWGEGTHGYPGHSFIGHNGNNGTSFAFTPQELLSNEIIQNWTSRGGGPNWLEYLSGCGLKQGRTLPSSCKVQLWNFAFGGAGTSEEFLPLHHPYTVSLVNQTRQYLAYADPVLSTRMDKRKSLVTIWVGINDLTGSISQGIKPDFADFYAEIVSYLFEKGLAPMFEAGYHNLLILTTPPRHRTPGNQKKAHPSPNLTLIETYNNMIYDNGARFSREHPHANMMVYDALSFLSAVLDDPAKYGISNTTHRWPASRDLRPEQLYYPERYGLPDVDGFFWWDHGHL